MSMSSKRWNTICTRLSRSPVGRLDRPQPGPNVEVSLSQLAEGHVRLLRPEQVDPGLGQRDPHGDVLARHLPPGLGVVERDHHVRPDLHLENSSELRTLSSNRGFCRIGPGRFIETVTRSGP